MKKPNIKMLVAAVALGTVPAVAGTPTTFATNDTGQLGDQFELVDGPVVQSWTVSELRSSRDNIPYAVQGALWEATATDTALQGNATPIVPRFHARAENGETYRVLFEVATAQGVNPATLLPGQSTSGKIYFDVTGDAPNRVVYRAGGQDRLVWAVIDNTTEPEVSASVAPTRDAPMPAAQLPTVAEQTPPSLPKPLPPNENATSINPPAPPPDVWEGTPLPTAGPELPPPAAVQPLPTAPPGTERQGTPLPPDPATRTAPPTSAPAPDGPAPADPRQAGESPATPLPSPTAPTTTPAPAP
ncbi:MPT63 family protein [soil metagenome]